MAPARQPSVLIVNPNAGRLTQSTRQEVVEAIASRLAVEVFFTSVRDAGIGLARDAADAGAGLVIAFGGDGLVNEVINGVAGTSSALAIVPGGTMNVFSRVLGIPQQPFRAVDHLMEALDRPTRSVSLGQMDDRYFAFSAGCGFDAEAAERVERYLTAKKRLGEAFFYWSAFRVLTRWGHRNASMTITGPFGEVPAALAIACNAGPYAYFAGRTVNLTPGVALDRGIGVFSLRSMRVEALPLYAWRVAVTGDLVHHPAAFYRSDVEEFEVTAAEPFSRHVDGEPLPRVAHTRLSIARDVLAVRV